jgi:two-component sensor histidine kinase
METMLQFKDVGEGRQTQAALEFLLSETRHRSLNLLAVVRALASQTPTEGRSAAEYRDAFLERFEALLVAQDISESAEADVGVLVCRILGPVDDARVCVRPGPPALLTSAQVLPLAMVLNELVTNAVKYGALSTAKGIVHVAWNVEATPEDRVLAIDWREEGGPEVTLPSRQGFGGQLINHSLKELRGTAALRFEHNGLQAALRMPLT